MTDVLTRQVMGFLGLCCRAGQAALGQDMCVAAIRAKGAGIALLDESCSENTRKRVHDSCAHHGVPLYGVPGGTISAAVGRSGRMVATVKPGGMADKLLLLLKDEPRLTDA